MPDCSFKIELRKNAGEVVDMARQAIIGAGGKFSGDEGTGEFSLSAGIGSINGNYAVEQGSMKIIISKKPLVLSCGRIEKEVRKYLDADAH
jgi:hypothetical protein